MQIAFITGCSSGIGSAAFQFLIAKGYHVIGTVRNQDDGEKLAQQYGKKCTVLRFDVRDIEAMKNGITSVMPMLETHGLKVLINNAGVAVPGPLQYLTEDEFEMQIDVNVKAVRRITNAMLPFLGVNKTFAPGNHQHIIGFWLVFVAI
jgi:NADP-dependent 3-hydroxy acid dehydrogenase YdfG